MHGGGDVKIGDMWRHSSTIAEAVAKYPDKRAIALSTVLQRDYGLRVKWKALQTYILRQGLWTVKRPIATSAIDVPNAPDATAATPVATIVDAKIADLPRYRDNIIAAIRSNPGKKAKALVSIALSDYAVRVQWQALHTYIDREKLYDIAAAAPSTPMRSTGAPSTPTGAPMQASPVRASPRRKVYAKIADLPLYKHRIVEAIKANPGKRDKALSAELERNYALVVYFMALKKYCDQHLSLIHI